MRVKYSEDVISRTLSDLQKAGRRDCECVVLWLGHIHNESIVVNEVYRPIQTARRDVFWITQEGMDELKSRLRSTRTMVAAQVHAHPRLAFHSAADDQWAIVRHEGALSLVLPYFALDSSLESFATDVKVFRLDGANTWREIARISMREYLSPF